MSESVTTEVADRVAVVEIHRGPNNFFDEALLRELSEAVVAVDERPEVRSIVLCSEGKHFCAGADLRDATAQTIRRIYRYAFALFTGRSVSGAEAQQLGLCDRVVDDDVRGAALEVATAIAGSAPLSLASIRSTMRRRLVADVSAALDTEAAAQAALLGTADFKEGVRASIERRAPEFEGK